MKLVRHSKHWPDIVVSQFRQGADHLRFEEAFEDGRVLAGIQAAPLVDPAERAQDSEVLWG